MQMRRMTLNKRAWARYYLGSYDSRYMISLGLASQSVRFKILASVVPSSGKHLPDSSTTSINLDKDGELI